MDYKDYITEKVREQPETVIIGQLKAYGFDFYAAMLEAEPDAKELASTFNLPSADEYEDMLEKEKYEWDEYCREADITMRK